MLISVISKLLFIFLFLNCSTQESTEIEQNMETIVISVNIKNYRFKYATELSSTFTLEEIESYFKKVNEIWDQAKIKFVINSFDSVTVVDSIFLNNNFEDYSNREFRKILENLSQTHINTNTLTNQGILTLVLIQKFPHPAGGVWSNKTEIVFFAKTKNGQKVVKNVLAHEFGHSLSLHHVDANQYPTNLMKFGDGNPSTAEILLEWQIKKAREQALFYMN